MTVKPGFLMIAVALVLSGCTGDFQPSLDQLRAAILEYQWLTVNPLVRWDPDYIPIASFQGE